jgi:hypothetical protein
MCMKKYNKQWQFLEAIISGAMTPGVGK